MIMEDYFVSKQVAHRLKDLGFNDRCFAMWVGDTLMFEDVLKGTPVKDAMFVLNEYFTNSQETAAAPLFCQAIDFLLFAEVYIEETVMLGGGFCVMVRGVKNVYEMFTGKQKYAVLSKAIEYAYTQLNIDDELKGRINRFPQF